MAVHSVVTCWTNRHCQFYSHSASITKTASGGKKKNLATCAFVIFQPQSIKLFLKTVLLGRTLPQPNNCHSLELKTMGLDRLWQGNLIAFCDQFRLTLTQNHRTKETH